MGARWFSVAFLQRWSGVGEGKGRTRASRAANRPEKLRTGGSTAACQDCASFSALSQASCPQFSPGERAGRREGVTANLPFAFQDPPSLPPAPPESFHATINAFIPSNCNSISSAPSVSPTFFIPSALPSPNLSTSSNGSQILRACSSRSAAFRRDGFVHSLLLPN